MECPKCVVANKEEAERCRICGAELRPRKRKAGPSKECPFCKAQNEGDAVFCVNCNKLLGEPTKKAIDGEEPKQRKEKYYDRTYTDYATSPLRTARTSFGGIIFLMAGVFALIDVLFTLGLGWEATQMEDYDELLRENPALKSAIPNLVACQAIRIVFACLALLGGLAALRRMQFGLAVAGGVFAILAVMTSVIALLLGMWLLLTGVFFLAAILGLILVLISRREFMLT
jgi:hypothetical protein